MSSHVVAALAFVLVSTAAAADVTILGRKLVVEVTATGDRVAIVSGSERASSDDVFGDPEHGGAVVTVFADGAFPSAGTFGLPGAVDGGDWKVERTTGGALASVRYRDHAGVHGPVRDVVLVDKPGGVLKVRVKVAGPPDVMPVRPPAPGTSGGMSLTLGEGLVCVALGGAAGGEVTNTADGERFRIRRATAEVGCPTPPPTVCGQSAYPACGLPCDPEIYPPSPTCQGIRVLEYPGIGCGCVPADGTCGAPPYFAGPCPAGEVCVTSVQAAEVVATGLLGCTAPPLCADGVWPVCGGNCPGDGTCQAVTIAGDPAMNLCVCVPPASTCGCPDGGTGFGLCAGEDVCSVVWPTFQQCSSARCVAASP